MITELAREEDSTCLDEIASGEYVYRKIVSRFLVIIALNFMGAVIGLNLYLDGSMIGFVGSVGIGIAGGAVILSWSERRARAGRAKKFETALDELDSPYHNQLTVEEFVEHRDVYLTHREDIEPAPVIFNV